MSLKVFVLVRKQRQTNLQSSDMRFYVLFLQSATQTDVQSSDMRFETEQTLSALSQIRTRLNLCLHSFCRYVVSNPNSFESPSAFFHVKALSFLNCSKTLLERCIQASCISQLTRIASSFRIPHMMKKRYETFGLISFCHVERGGFACCGCSLPVRSLRRPTSSRSAKHPVLLLRISCFSQLTRIASSFRIPHDEKKDMKPSASYLFVMRREGDSPAAVAHFQFAPCAGPLPAAQQNIQFCFSVLAVFHS